MEGISEKVLAHINEYFKENLPRYEVVEVRKKSYHPDDAHLYMVASKKNDGAYAVWTGWNDNTRSLNFGHYDLKDLDACHKVMDEYFFG